MFLFGIGVAEAKMLLPPAIDVKWLANDEADAVLGGFAQQGARAQVLRQATPEMEAAIWNVHPHLSRPVTPNGIQGQIALAFVSLPEHDKMIVQQVAAQDFRDSPLAQRRCIQVKHLFVQAQPLDQWFRRGQPGDTQAGSQHFRIGAEIENLVMMVQSLERLERLPLEVDFAVRIIFQNWRLVAARKQEQAATAFGRHYRTGGVLERRHGVDQARAMTRQDGFQQVNSNAFAIGWYANDARIQGAERLNSSQVGRHLDHHFVAWTEQETTNEANALRGTRKNKDMRGIHRGDAASSHGSRYVPTQALQSLNGTIAERVLPGVEQAFIKDGIEHFGGKQVAGRCGGGEGNDLVAL